MDANATSKNDKVKFGVTLQNINIGWDGFVEAKIWTSLEWNDHRLKWDSTTEGKPKAVSVPTSMIWTPDIMMYNW